MICNRFGPWFTEPVVAGLTDEGKPFLSGMDLIGAPVFAHDFVVAGTCTSNLHGMCEALYRPNMVRRTPPGLLYYCLAHLSLLLPLSVFRTLTSCSRCCRRACWPPWTAMHSAGGEPLFTLCKYNNLSQLVVVHTLTVALPNLRLVLCTRVRVRVHVVQHARGSHHTEA